MLKEESALGGWLWFLPLPISRGNCGRWKTKSRHLQPHVSPESSSCLTFRPCTGSLMCSAPMPSLSFQLEAEQNRTSTAYPGTKKMPARHSNQHVWGRSRDRSDISGAGYCSCCSSPGANFTWGDTTETKVNDSPWHHRHFQMLQAAKVWKDGYCHFGQVPVTAAGCSWSAKWRSLSGQAWEICPSHYQSAGTQGLAQARKWELSWSLAFLPTINYKLINY